MTQHYQELATLRDALAALYADETSARRVCKDVGLKVQQINFSARAVDTWTAILDEADKQAAIPDIVAVARKEYPRNRQLLIAAATYEHASTISSLESPNVLLDTVAPTPPIQVVSRPAFNVPIWIWGVPIWIWATGGIWGAIFLWVAIFGTPSLSTGVMETLGRFSFCGWIIFGGIVGWIFSLITSRNNRQGCLMNILAGVIGALIGGYIVGLIFGGGVSGFNIWSFFVAILGAVVFLLILNFFQRPR